MRQPVRRVVASFSPGFLQDIGLVVLCHLPSVSSGFDINQRIGGKQAYF